ncbi:MAG: diguanylate cyclase [SAR324 cluster bacterium]|nr:diguanylate cyclase [SAR324 cluster bacterium]
MKAKTVILLARDRELLNNSLAVLMKGKYFRTMAKNTLRQVLRQGTYLEVPKGTILIKEGESDDDLYFLLDGAVVVMSGSKVILELDSPADVVGEFAVVSSAARSADVVTSQPSRLIRVSSKAVHDPKLATEFLMVFSHIMAAKLVETSARAKLYEDAVLEARQMASSQSKLEGEIGDTLKEITLYSKIIETSNDAVLVTDVDGVVQRFNPAAKGMFEELGGKEVAANVQVLDLVKDFDLDDYMDQAPDAPWRGEWSKETEEGLVVLHTTASPIVGSDGTLQGRAFQLRDISLQKEQEQAISLTNEMIQKALIDLETTHEELQRNDKLKSETLNIVSEELTAPIRKIFTYTEMLSQQIDGASNPQAHENLDSIQEQSTYIKAISDNINQLIEIQKNFQTVKLEQVNLTAILREIDGELSPLAGRKGITIEMSLPEEPMTLTGDTRQIHLVMNLLVEQAIMVGVTNSLISVVGGVHEDSQQIQLVISYQGASFSNLKPADAMAQGRFGLMIGLPLARKVVSQNQGSLQFLGDSKTGQIHLRLPWSQKEGVDRPNRIFIADESDMDQLIIKGVIDYLWSDSVLYATKDPFDFLDNYEDFKPDLVIVDPDFSTPGWSNHRIIASLVQNRRHACPILALSGLYQDFAERSIAVERGVNDFLDKPYSIFDLRFKVKSLLQSHRKEETLHQTMDMAQRQAQTDGLTRLANRKHFDEFLETQINYSRQTGKPCSLVMLDIDNFKHYNDSHGHQMGDEVLKHVARLLASSVRASDLAARYGGEEFVLVMPETKKDMAAIVAEKVRRAIEEAKLPKADQQPLGVMSASFGVSTYEEDGTSGAELIKAADDCLYIAKDQGRNIVIKAGDSTPSSKAASD